MTTLFAHAGVVPALLFMTLCTIGGQAAASTASEPLSMAGRNLGLDAPSARIYRSVSQDGAVVFGDQPQAGAASMQVRT